MFALFLLLFVLLFLLLEGPLDLFYGLTKALIHC